ncbi:MAG: hypothetical protein JW808_11350, partial [Victivallales bacterium]|nr:hypothetical protein [Victivallales bacterium]
WSIFRTIGFAGALENLGACENVPVAKTFDAIWDKGGPTLQDSARAMWPLFPVHCRKQMTSMLETDGKGDPIHPNALGHLMFAKSIFNTIAGVGFGEEIIQFTGSSHWTDKGLISKISAVNRSGVRQEGMLKVYPQFFFGNANSPAALMRNNGTYSLNPGETFDIEIQWPEVKRPGDLLKYPYSIHTVRVEPFLPVVNYSGNKSSVHPVRVPFDLECRILPNRQVVKGNEVCYAVNCGGRNQVFSAEIPADSEVGLIPLVEKIANGGKTGWAVAEILYARYAAALKGEATVDGRLDEWGEHSWIPIGEQVQARARNGAIEDNRKSPDEFYLKWAFKAGEKGLYLAAKIKGTLLKDRFFVFFDPRTPENLGTVGRYYWLSGEVEQNKNKQNPTNGRLVLKNGETSPKACGKTLTACSFADNEGAIEILVPYELMETSAWPESNDLGISIVWAHYHGDQKITRMTWTETGHEWTPCNYGVVRLVEHGHPSTKLPYLAIIK